MTDYISRHNADGGLQLLRHLGLDMTEQEEVAFVSIWDSIYQSNGGHFLSATCRLYGILPFAVAGEDIDEDARHQREEVYTGKINSVKLEPWMRE